jgi:hypothetical protein
MSHRTFALAALLSLALSAPTLAGDSDQPEAPAAPHVIDPTWDRGDDLEPYLIGLVTADVEKELAEGAPGFELAELADYVADPSSLPAKLGGRAGDALWMYLPVLLAQGELDLAIGLLEMLRDPAANLNPKVIHHGALTYSELLRRGAGSEAGQKAAIKSVLDDLPPKRFFESVATIDTLLEAAETEAGAELPQMYASALANSQTYAANPDSASGWLYRHQITKGLWQHVQTFDAARDSLQASMEKRLAKQRPHSFATVDMEQHADEAQRVVIGIMDSGVAPMRFDMYENPGEWPNGLDDDGNDTVDDIHGLVWDWDPDKRHQHGNLDLVEQLEPALVREFETYIIGSTYRRTNRGDMPEAVAYNAKLTSLSSVEEQKVFRRQFGEIGEWSHGTHVAGLATAGNRWAQVAAFRFAWTGEGRIYFERGPSDQELRWERESIHQMIAWVNEHDVRAINASLGFTVDYQEAALSKERDVFDPSYPAYAELDDQGNKTHELDLEAIHARAVQIQEHRRESWRLLFDGCPDTLFVLAAGNSDHSITEFMDVPTTIPVQHNNLLIVGAVDADGDWARFTNFEEDLVQVYDLGVFVWSTSPTGRMIPMSGTSMAAPSAANTVGKIFSLYPDLTPSQVRAVMIETAEPFRAPFSGGIVDEPAAVQAAGRL